jgi:lysozyme family protein
MNPGAELQYEIARAITTLRRRHAITSDAGERKVLTRVIQRLNKRLAALDQAPTLAVAQTLTESLERLEIAVAAAKHAPFDGYLSALEGHFDSLSALSGAIHKRDCLPPTPENDEIESAAEQAIRPRKMARGATGAGLQPPATATDFAALRDEYAAWYAACELRPERRGELAYYIKRLTAGQPIYQQIGAELEIPWAFIGITHGMECGFNFTAHLHNGDPLGARTVHVPKGRPMSGRPPFTWSQSARDALICNGYHQISDWSVPHMLYLFERYNGMGYRRRSLPSPYLWSYSNLYEKGKFVTDGYFDPEAVSKQCGAALMLKAVLA